MTTTPSDAGSGGGPAARTPDRATTRGTTTTTSTAPRQPPRSVARFSVLLLLAQFGWAGVGAATSTLMAALAAEVRPRDKVDFLAVLTTSGAVVAVISMVVAGSLSDRTRTRFGPRNPWILGGAVVSALGLAGLGLTRTAALLVACNMLYQVGLNGMLGALNAVMPDYLGDSDLGKVSASGGAGYLVGQIVGAVLGAAFVTHPSTGLLVVPWLTPVTAIILVLFLPPHPLRDAPRVPGVGVRGFLSALMPPRDREFWWIFAGRFMFILALFMTMQFQLYIATDLLHLSTSRAGALVGLNSAVFAVGATVLTLVTGPLSDRIGRRKPFVEAAPVVAAIGIVPLLLVHQPWALVVFALLGGCAFGSYISVDGALMVQVLPGRDAAARDLGFLNAANSLPIVFAPGVAALLVGAVGYSMTFVVGIVAAIAGALCITRVHRVR